MTLLQVTKATVCTSAMRLQITTTAIRVVEQPLQPVLSNHCPRGHASRVWPCTRAHLTRPAGDARLNSARTLASPKALSSTHKTGKRRGRMGRTPISCKIHLIACVTNKTGNVWSGKAGRKRLFLPGAGRNCSRGEWGWVRHRRSEWCWRVGTQPARKDQRGNRGSFYFEDFEGMTSFSWAQSKLIE